MNNEVNINITDAKQFCTEKLQNKLTPKIYSSISQIFEISNTHPNPGCSVHSTFQERLKDIHGWNIKIIREEVDRIIKPEDRQEIELLVSTIMMCIASSLAKARSVEFNDAIPFDLENFIHDCLIQSGEKFMMEPFLFGNWDVMTTIENRKKSLEIIDKSIVSTINSSVPIKSIFESNKKPRYDWAEMEKAWQKYDDDKKAQGKRERKYNENDIFGANIDPPSRFFEKEQSMIKVITVSKDFDENKAENEDKKEEIEEKKSEKSFSYIYTPSMIMTKKELS